MRSTKQVVFFLFFANCTLLFLGCSLDDPSTGFVPPTAVVQKVCEVEDSGWTISTATLIDGGVGKDGFQSMESPIFVPVDQVDLVQDDELVVVMKRGDIVRAYPHRYLGPHEVVNDLLDGLPVSVTLCPLTGTAIAFEREINGGITTLGVSGLLYNNNLILYDRETDTNWSQMTTQGINGPLSCENLNYVPALEMSWKGVKTWFPEAMVLVGDNTLVRTYERPPQSSLVFEEGRPFFPYNPKDTRLPNYRRSHIVIDSTKTTIYTLDQFLEQIDLVVDNTTILITDPSIDFITSYKTASVNLRLASDPDSGVVMVDSDGNKYNLFGEVISGEIGKRLEPTFSYMGYWFALAAMYPDPLIFENGQD